jgi:hypothetical protein
MANVRRRGVRDARAVIHFKHTCIICCGKNGEVVTDRSKISRDMPPAGDSERKAQMLINADTPELRILAT